MLIANHHKSESEEDYVPLVSKGVLFYLYYSTVFVIFLQR